MERKIELIAWEDAYSSTKNWTEIKKMKVDPFIAHTVGFVVHESKKRVTLALNTSDCRMCADTMTIPKKLITERRELAKVVTK